MVSFEAVENHLEEAKGIAWDGCHKIYVLMDQNQVELMRDYEYQFIVAADDSTYNDMVATVKDWYEKSCPLRFVQAVMTVDGDANEGFSSLIGQFDDDFDDFDEEDEDEDEDDN